MHKSLSVIAKIAIAALPADESNIPTPERHMHGLVLRAPGPVKADPGDFDVPYRAIDLIAGMLDRGTISKQEELAADRFRAWFALGSLEGLRAADLEKPRVDGGSAPIKISYHSEKARTEVHRAIRWLGGRAALGADCIWHVVGLDDSLRKWAELQRNNGRNINHLHASGILVDALARLGAMPWSGPWEEIA